MATAVSKSRKFHGKYSDLTGGFSKADKKLSEKGAFYEDRVIKKKKDAKESQEEQKQAIGQQEVKENLRLRENEEDIARRRLLRKTGGRQSLIASK